MPLDGTTNPTTQVIVDAIDYLDRYGWCQDMPQHGARMCLWGALRNAAGADHPDLLKSALWRVATASDMGEIGVPAWNDAPGRTKQQVIAALQKAL